MELPFAGTFFWIALLVYVITLCFAFLERSWEWVLVSGGALFPDTWYMSGYPLFPWIIVIPLLHFVLAGAFYIRHKK